MKHLVSFFFLIVSVIECSSLLKSLHSDVINNFDDSITDIIEDKKFLYYTKGHHGHIWSLVVPEKSCYIIVSGNTRTNDHKIDTVYTNVSTLKWGLDTMASYCQKMKPIANVHYLPFHERLVLFSSDKEIIFDCSDTNIYSGPDSTTFNKKLNRLKYLMYWMASPIENQKRLPQPL